MIRCQERSRVHCYWNIVLGSFFEQSTSESSRIIATRGIMD